MPHEHHEKGTTKRSRIIRSTSRVRMRRVWLRWRIFPQVKCNLQHARAAFAALDGQDAALFLFIINLLGDIDGVFD